MKVLLLGLFLVWSLQAQFGNFYSVFEEDVALTAATLRVTIQQTGQHHPEFDYLEVRCVDTGASDGCVLTISRDGTAATTTAVTPVGTNFTTPVALTAAFTDSNAGSGTVLRKLYVPEGATIGLNLIGMDLARGGGSTDNLTFEIDTITGSAYIFVRWKE